ncbi:MAG: agmatinase [Candidatus Magnetomorum sp.]|nr:agmatinase [Candidatus Magnetomorum sp.]
METIEPYQGFLASELGKPSPDKSLFHIISAGYEDTVSYGTGTKNGPEAIIKASQQLELFDGKAIPADSGIYTHPPLIFGQSCEENLLLIETSIASILKKKKIPVLLGGEHTVSVGAFRALSKLEDTFGIVQFDAHADLRDSYEGNLFSHACVMKRAIDLGFSIAQLGVRSLSYEEHLLRKEKNIFHIDAVDLAEKGIPEIVLPDAFPEKIYITFDVDSLDPSVIPSTGTPEPGGLLWYQALALLNQISKERQMIGFDVVELSPITGHHASDFATAKLVYAMMGLY